MASESPDFPLLGEPLPIELANTSYADASGTIDFLRSSAWILEWCRAALTGRQLDLPVKLTLRQADQVRALRDAIRDVLVATLDHEPVVPLAAVAMINAAARLAPAAPIIEWSAGVAPFATVKRTRPRFEVLLSTLGSECVELVTGPRPGSVRRCARPGCFMLFEQHHRRRRYCSPRCASADRQARYNRRRLHRSGSGSYGR